MSLQRILDYECFFCDQCRQYFYDESAGDVKRGVAPHTRVEALSSAWTCPVCGASRNKLRLVTMMDDYLDEPKTIENAAAPFISVNPGEEFTEAAQSLQSKG